jgi:hypothetical protein
MGTMLRGRCRDGTGSLTPTSPTTLREATMSEVNDAALDSLDDAEGDERPEVEADADDDGEELESLTQDDLALESPEADTAEQKVEVRIDEDEYR